MKKILRSPVATVLLFILAVSVLLFGSIGGTRAALNATSEIYESQLETARIGVSLMEGDGSKNTVIASDGSNGLLMSLTSGDMVKRAGDDSLKIGKEYSLPVYVLNSGAIPEYVRVTVYRYWTKPSETPGETGWFNGSGTKQTDMDPTLIKIQPAEGWVEDTSAPSESGERMVFYTHSILQPGDSIQFLESVCVDANVLKDLREVRQGERMVYTYSYAGLGFVLEIEADAVQTHNGEQAIMGIWGQTIPG